MIVFANAVMLQAINFVDNALHEKMAVSLHHKSHYFHIQQFICDYLRLILFISLNQHPFSSNNRFPKPIHAAS